MGNLKGDDLQHHELSRNIMINCFSEFIWYLWCLWDAENSPVSLNEKGQVKHDL
jgi:hypothetical protein